MTRGREHAWHRPVGLPPLHLKPWKPGCSVPFPWLTLALARVLHRQVSYEAAAATRMPSTTITCVLARFIY